MAVTAAMRLWLNQPGVRPEVVINWYVTLGKSSHLSEPLFPGGAVGDFVQIPSQGCRWEEVSGAGGTQLT